jgi:hypothetical protein
LQSFGLELVKNHLTGWLKFGISSNKFDFFEISKREARKEPSIKARSAKRAPYRSAKREKSPLSKREA